MLSRHTLKRHFLKDDQDPPRFQDPPAKKRQLKYLSLCVNSPLVHFVFQISANIVVWFWIAECFIEIDRYNNMGILKNNRENIEKAIFCFEDHFGFFFAIYEGRLIKIIVVVVIFFKHSQLWLKIIEQNIFRVKIKILRRPNCTLKSRGVGAKRKSISLFWT